MEVHYLKWFKHHTDSLSDPFIEELMDNFSHAGYVAWFGLIEIICKENKNNLTGNLEISPVYLKRKLRISKTKLQQIFNFCQTNDKLLFDFSKEKWNFKFSKVAEIKDNYTKDLQETNKKVSIDKEKDKEKENKIKKQKEEWFEIIWKKYPVKDGKKYASKHFNTTIKNETDWNNINQALTNYLQSDRVKKGFIKNGSTWFNNWQDWIDYIEPTIEPKDCEIIIDGEITYVTETELNQWMAEHGR